MNIFHNFSKMKNGSHPLNARNLLKKFYQNNFDKMNNNLIFNEEKNYSQDRRPPEIRTIKIKNNNINSNSKPAINILLNNNIDRPLPLYQILFKNYNSFINHDKNEINLDNYLSIINRKKLKDNNKMESVEWIYLNNLAKNFFFNKTKKEKINIQPHNSFKNNNIIKKKFNFPALFSNNEKKTIRLDKNKSTASKNKIVINAQVRKNTLYNTKKEENKINLNDIKNIMKKRKLNNYYFSSLNGIHNNKKKVNQDCYLFLPKINDCEKVNLFGIFNGHGPYGDLLAKELSQFFSDFFSQKNLYILEDNNNDNEIINNNKNKNNNDDKSERKKLSISLIETKKNSNVIPVILSQKNCLRIPKIKLLIDKKNQKIKDTYAILHNNNFSKIFESFNEIDKKLHEKYSENKKCDDSGSSLNLIFLFNSKNINKIISINLGNTKSILISEDKRIKELNICHTPCIKEERIRIEKHGGVIDRIDWLKVGPLRVWFKGKKFPGLTITRSLGDFEAIPLGIIPIPDIKEFDIDEEKIKILVMASIGIWEFLTNDKIMDITLQFYESKDSQGATEKIIETAEKIWRIKNPNNIPDLTASVFFF